jgi:hypothetical protein
VAIQERVSSKGKHWYFIDTSHGGYDVEDRDFLEKAGSQIIERLGFIEGVAKYTNIARVYCKRSADGTFYNRQFKRASGSEHFLFELWMSLVTSCLGLFLMIPNGYVYLHPDNRNISPIFARARFKRDPPVILVRILTATLFAVGLCLLLLMPVLHVAFR